jgi:oligosaccharyltransferase complex subunit gamma
VAGDGKGGISYYAGGFQNQLAIETHIVGFICKSPTPSHHIICCTNISIPDGLLSLASIALILKVPRVVDVKVQQLSVIIWSGVIFLVYGYLLSVFRIKNGGYPFSLPPFF